MNNAWTTRRAKYVVLQRPLLLAWPRSHFAALAWHLMKLDHWTSFLGQPMCKWLCEESQKSWSHGVSVVSYVWFWRKRWALPKYVGRIVSGLSNAIQFRNVIWFWMGRHLLNRILWCPLQLIRKPFSWFHSLPPVVDCCLLFKALIVWEQVTTMIVVTGRRGRSTNQFQELS